MQPVDISNEDDVVEALKEITGAEQVKSVRAYHPDTGNEVLVPGYKVQLDGASAKPANLYTFVNEKGQTHQVPGHRVEELVERLRPQPKPDKGKKQDPA